MDVCVLPVYIHFYFKNTYFHINFYIVTFIAFYCSVGEVFIVYRRTEFSSIIFILLDLMMGSILMSPLAGPVDSLNFPSWNFCSHFSRNFEIIGLTDDLFTEM